MIHEHAYLDPTTGGAIQGCEDGFGLLVSAGCEIFEVDEALSRLAEVDERKAKVIELRYFGGMTREETACALGLTVATVKRDLRLAEVWLRRYLVGPG